MRKLLLILLSPLALIALLLITPVILIGIYYTAKELDRRCPDCGDILNPRERCQNSHCQIKENWREATKPISSKP